jgi:amidohydrolase
MKQEIWETIEQSAPRWIELANWIFDHPELGNQEFQASARILEPLEEAGFKIERNLAGLPTAFRAEYRQGQGGPLIGLLTEYDALEKLGHACGHHLQGPAIVACALAIIETVKELPFTLVVYGTPAEETTSGKITMLQHGYFEELDAALMIHANPGTTVDVKSMALATFTVTFHGITSHAAVKPEAGRSALDGLLLSFQGVEFLREHVPDDVRMHYTVIDGGGAANSVPAKAVGHFYLRSYDSHTLKDVKRRFYQVIEGAALMSDTKAAIVAEKEIDAKIPVLTLNDLLMQNANEVNAPHICPPREKTGSTDFGNVMVRVPGSCLRMDFVPLGTPSHSEAYLAVGKGEAAVTAIIVGAKILAGSVYQLISEPELLEKVRNEFREAKK